MIVRFYIMEMTENMRLFIDIITKVIMNETNGPRAADPGVYIVLQVVE